MKDLVTYIVKAMVAHPDQVEVKELENNNSVTLEVRVSPEDLGRIIGRMGRTAQALRTLVSVAAQRQGKKVTVQILD